MGNAKRRRAASSRAARQDARVFIADLPDGQPRENGKGRSWSFHPNRPATCEETGFLIAALCGPKQDDMLLSVFDRWVGEWLCRLPETRRL